MKFSDLIAQMHEKGYSEEKSLRLVKQRLEASGSELSPIKMQLFNVVWTELEKMSKEKEIPTKKTILDRIKEEKLKPSKTIEAPRRKPSLIQTLPKTSIKDTSSKPRVVPVVDNTPHGENKAFTQLLTLGMVIIAWIKGKKLAGIRPLIVQTKPNVDELLKKTKMNLKSYDKIVGLIIDIKKYNPETRRAEVANLGIGLLNVLPKFSDRSYQIPLARLNYLKGIASYMKSSKQSDSGLKNLFNKCHELKVPQLDALFLEDMQKLAPEIDNERVDELYDIITKFRKANKANAAGIIPQETLKKYQELKKPDAKFVEYNAAVKEIKQHYLALIKSIVIGSGESLVDVDEVRAQLKAAGMEYSAIPIGFEGKMNVKGQLFTNEGYLLINQPIGIVTMDNGKNYDPATGIGSYCVYKKPGGSNQQCYTQLHADRKREPKKQAVIDDFIENLDAYRGKWMKTIKAGINDKSVTDYTEAVMTEAMYQLAPRPGSTEVGKSKKNDDNTGFIYLKKKHVEIDGNIVRFEYRNKDTVQHLMLSPTPGFDQDAQQAKMLVDAVKYFYKRAKSPEDFLWVDSDGHNITYSEMNIYKKKVMPKFGFHKFRNAKATVMAQKLLGECKLKTGATTDEVNSYYMDVMTRVGAELGHHTKDKPSPSMAISNYVLKSTSNAFFDKYNVSAKGIAAKALDKAIASSYMPELRKKK